MLLGTQVVLLEFGAALAELAVLLLPVLAVAVAAPKSALILCRGQVRPLGWHRLASLGDAIYRPAL